MPFNVPSVIGSTQSMNPISMVRQNLIGFVALSIIIFSVLYSGLIKPVAARDIDARYFYVAARCWASGESPYDTTLYKAKYRAIFGAEPDALFVAYLPTLMPAILPMAPFKWSTAARLFGALNFSAAMLLLWASYRLVRDFLKAPLRFNHWLWLTLGMTIGGVSGTISTGQTSLIIGAACVVALLGCRLNNRLLVIVGSVIASAKPHLSAPILLFILFFEPQQRRAVLLAGAITFAFIAYAALLDGNFIANYINSFINYNAISNNDPRLQIGLGSFLAATRLPALAIQGLCIAALVISLALAASFRRRVDLGSCGLALSLMLIVFTVGVGHPIQGYDVCIYAIGITLCSTQPYRVQLALLIPAVLLWRPTIISHGLSAAVEPASIANFGWLMMYLGCAYCVIRILRVRSESSH